MPFIIYDDQAIWGAGETEAGAWADWKREMKMARMVPNRAGFVARRATPALVQQVLERGGAIAFGANPDGIAGAIACTIDEIACTIDEEDAAADAAV